MTYTRSAVLKVLEDQENRESGWRGYAQSETANTRDLYDARGDQYEAFVIPQPVVPLYSLVEGKDYTLDTYDVDDISEVSDGIYVMQGEVEELMGKLFKAMFCADLRTTYACINGLLMQKPRSEVESIVRDSYEEIREMSRLFINQSRNQRQLDCIVNVLGEVDEVVNALLPEYYYSIQSKPLFEAYRYACDRAVYVATMKAKQEVCIAT